MFSRVRCIVQQTARVNGATLELVLFECGANPNVRYMDGKTFLRLLLEGQWRYCDGDDILGLVSLSLERGADANTQDLPKAKSCLEVLFMLALCTLHADLAGEEALNALATPLAWQELCPYIHQLGEVVLLLLTMQNAHGDRLLVLDTEAAVTLCLLIQHGQLWISPARPPRQVGLRWCNHQELTERA